MPDASGIPESRGAALRALYAALPVPQTMIEVAQGFAAAGKGGAPPFMYWQKYAADSPKFAPQDVMRALCPKLSRAEVAAYQAPFPDDSTSRARAASPRSCRSLPDDPAVPDNRRAWQALARFTRSRA
jgi:haloalkane dehalogenase